MKWWNDVIIPNRKLDSPTNYRYKASDALEFAWGGVFEVKLTGIA